VTRVVRGLGTRLLDTSGTIRAQPVDMQDDPRKDFLGRSRIPSGPGLESLVESRSALPRTGHLADT